jgi:hypothetical protein
LSIGALRVEHGGATIVPAGHGFSAGERVVVLAAPGALRVDAQGLVLAAAQVRVEGVAGAREVTLGGQVLGLDRAGTRFELGGIPVDLAGAVVTPASRSLAEGQYVQVQGRIDDDGTLRAAHVKIRALSGEPEVELLGSVVAPGPGGLEFSVRGVAVDARGARFPACPAGGVQEGQYVDVDGRISATGVLAERVRCVHEPAGAVIERAGTAGAVDAAARRFVLAPASAPSVDVRWTPATLFDGLTPETLDAADVIVEGVLVGGELLARRIRPAP